MRYTGGIPLSPRELLSGSVRPLPTSIPVEKQMAIFKPFTEIKDLTDGDGLGLPICSLIASKMNGTLSIDPEYKKGSRFILVLQV